MKTRTSTFNQYRNNNRTGRGAIRGVVLALGAVVALGAADVSMARADATVVSKITITSTTERPKGSKAYKPVNPASTSSTTETAYYKGPQVRIEAQGMVLLFDGSAGKEFVLDPVKKTYLLIDPTHPSKTMMDMFKAVTTTTLKLTGATRTILGHKATEYAFSASIALSEDMSGMTGDGQDGKSNPASLVPVGGMQVTGREWVVALDAVPSGKSGGIPGISADYGLTFPGMKALTDKLLAIPGIPVLAQQTTAGHIGMVVSVGGAVAQAPKTTMTVDYKTISISEAPVPDSLFAIPEGYKQVTSEKADLSPEGAGTPPPSH